MKKSLLFFLLLPVLLNAQYYQQYFDGADTSALNSVIVIIDDTLSQWQVGAPQKTVFNSPFTAPNVIMTDTIEPIWDNDTSSFRFGISLSNFWYNILAVQWVQKIDLLDSVDIGLIEVSTDSGQTWQNPFTDPMTYNFYGFNNQLLDTLANGQVGFSGTDTTWRNIWLCHDLSPILGLGLDSIHYRFTLISGNQFGGNRDGWMIDNLRVEPTMVHTVNEIEQENYLLVAPNPASGFLEIKLQAQKDEMHFIESISIHDIKGSLVKQFGTRPRKTRIDISDIPRGSYNLLVRSNLREVSTKILVE